MPDGPVTNLTLFAQIRSAILGTFSAVADKSARHFFADGSGAQSPAHRGCIGDGRVNGNADRGAAQEP